MRRALLLMLAVPLVVLAPPARAATTYTIHIAAETQYAQCNGGYPIFNPYGSSPKLPVPVTVVFVNDDPRPDCVVSVYLSGIGILNVPGGSSRSGTLADPGQYGYQSGPHDGYGGADTKGLINAVSAPSPAPPTATTTPSVTPTPTGGVQSSSPSPSRTGHAPATARQISLPTQGASPTLTASAAGTTGIVASPSASPSGSEATDPPDPLAAPRLSTGGPSLLLSVLTGALGAGLALCVGWIIRARRRSSRLAA